MNERGMIIDAIFSSISVKMVNIEGETQESEGGSFPHYFRVEMILWISTDSNCL